jgi:citronellol/citronellal dehydrogenase
VITGAGTGLGRAIAEEYGRLGAYVVACGRRSELLERTVEDIRAQGRSGHAYALNIRNDEEVASFVEQTAAKCGTIDVLVNNAGGQFYAPAEHISPKGFDAVVDLNLIGTYRMTHAIATEVFIPKRRGRVLSVTISPHSGNPGGTHSSAARAGVENMTRSLSLEWGRFGITLCAIAVSSVETDVWSKYPREAVASLAEETCVGRLGRPEELAWLAAYLAAEASDFITGAVINFDGGRDNGLPLKHELETEARR